MKRVKILDYVDQLDNFNGEEYGKKSFHEGIELSQIKDPTRGYRVKKEETVDLFNKILEDISRGWLKESLVANKNKYNERLVDFKKTLPEVGSIVYVEFPSNLGKYFKVEVVYTTKEKDQACLLFLDKKGTYGENLLKTISYRPNNGFVRFYKERPKENE